MITPIVWLRQLWSQIPLTSAKISHNPGQAAGQAMQSRWRELPDVVNSGWWLLLAEVLSVVILLALAFVTGPVASNMSSQVELIALASMAASDSYTICMKARPTLETGFYLPSANLTMRPVFQAPHDPHGGTLQQKQYTSTSFGVPYQLPVAGEKGYAGTPGNLNMMWRWPFLPLTNSTPDSPNSTVTGELLLQLLIEGLSALRHCNVITGAYCDLDVPSYIARDCAQCDESVKSPPYGVDWADGAGIMSARRNVSSMLACLFDDSLVAQDLSNTLNNAAQRFNSTLLLTHFVVEGKLKAKPERVMGGIVLGPGTLRIDTYNMALMSVGLFNPARMLWMDWAEQNKTTATCMDQNAPKLVSFLVNGQYRFPTGASEGPSVQLGVPANMGMQIEQLWLLLDASEYTRDRILLYKCTESIWETAWAQSASAMSKRSVFQAWAKKKYTVSLFGSMQGLTYDDVYAVYTAILGALFGSFALLVATLFAFALGVVKHLASTLMCHS